MPSGRKNRVVVSCVILETAKITDPIAFYQATHVHLIRYTKDSESKDGKMYKEFYDRVCEIIHEQSPFDVEIEEHVAKVYDFAAMLRTVLSIIQKERRDSPNSDIYVNISAGTPEYAAAAAIASMMIPGTMPFSVGTDEWTIQTETIKKIYYENDKPIGYTKKAREPYQMPYYSIDIPKEHLVRALRVLHERNNNRQPVTNTKMIESLKEKKLWFRGEMIIEKKKRKTDENKSDAVYYQRDFIEKWQNNEWIQKNELTKKYELTDAGKNILNTFYTDE